MEDQEKKGNNERKVIVNGITRFENIPEKDVIALVSALVTSMKEYMDKR